MLVFLGLKFPQIQSLKLIPQQGHHMKQAQIASKLGLKAQLQTVPIQSIHLQALQELQNMPLIRVIVQHQRATITTVHLEDIHMYVLVIGIIERQLDHHSILQLQPHLQHLVLFVRDSQLT